jgi:hypothetical protein
MKYAIKRISSTLVNESNFKLYQSELARTAISHPICLPEIARIFTTYAFHGFAIDRVALRRLIETVVTEHCPLQHDLEVAWALWIALALDVRVSKSIGDDVQNIESSVCRILALDLKARGQLAHSLSALKSLNFDSHQLYDERWLLAYEAPMHGWTKSTAHIGADAWFSQLQAKNVRFYNPAYKLKPLFQRKPVPEKARGLGAVQRAFMADRTVKQLSKSPFDPALFLKFVLDVGGYDNREFEDNAPD